MNAGEKERLRMAYKKKKEAKPVIKPSQVQWSFVYVGNLSSSVTDAQLAALFGPCGPIRRIQIRASGGICVPTANLPRPYFGFGKVDTAVHYATVEFESSDGSRKAMELDRRVLEGRQIIVTFNIADLPETCDILKTFVATKDAHQEKRAAWKAKFGQLKRLTIQRTERIPDPNSGVVATLANVAERLGFVEPAGNTAAAGAHQKAARHPLKRAKPGLHLPGGLLSL
ncbi:uncharacterized protein TRAVEDRAFT_57037 [Trametes versicolor FP-101664 SS1]|uniref:uncharacterized protein n=1 Tax=Trametes versicolor (strain FP-101664) TaxID=717944 RepID=UPI0004624027|nr:uncharacterized protein TRAVEDRAFT_57037 [Trametes versicolor FP-101664 SS1]EIW61854.1 hypothetical protein TRAVEDRAFT_57037 [Trametes versicolor FP-101664 SS1]